MGILRSDRITGLGGANAIKGSVMFTSGGSLEINLDGATIGTSNFTLEAWVFWFGNYYHQLTGTESTNFNFYINNDDGDLVFYDGSTTFDLSSSNIKPNEWTHIALVREGTSTNETKVYINGTNTQNITVATNFSFSRLAIGAANFVQSNVYGNGYTSNLRFTLDAVYTSAFTPPNNELTLLDNTIVLCCQSPGNIFQEATGKTISSFRNSLNSADAQASHFTPNSPVGFSTTTDVGSQYGTTFDGFTVFATSTYLVPPGGNTRERNRGRALYAGGYKTPNTITAIDSIEIQSGGLTEQFGDLSTTQHANCSACSSSTRMVTNGGFGPSANNNIMEFVTIANSSNSTDFGDLAVGRRNNIAASNQTRGLVYGGNGSPANTAQVDFFTIATAGNAADFGDASSSTALSPAGGSSTTRALFAVASTPSASDTIDLFTIASTGDATDFGNLTSARLAPGGLSSSTRTVFGGGGQPSEVNTIDFVTTATTGNATDFGDLFLARSLCHGTSDQTRGIFMGGTTSPARQDTIDSIEIATTGNAVNWGDFRTAKQNGGVASDSHGGL